MLSLLFELSANLFDGWLGAWFVLRFNGEKLSEHRLSTAITTLLCFAVSTAYLYISAFSMLQSVIILAILLGYSFIIKGGNIAKRLLSPVVFELILIIVSSLCSILFGSMFSMSLDELFAQTSIARYLFVISAKIIMTSVCFIVLRLTAREHHIRMSDLLIYLIFPGMTIFVLYTFMLMGIRYDVNDFSAHILISILGLALLNALTLLLFLRASHNAKAKAELEILKRQRELEQRNYAESGKLYEQLSTLRHDLRQHLIALKEMSANSRDDAVGRYICDVEEAINRGASPIHTGNRTLDYIINAKISANPSVTFLLAGECATLSGIDEFDLASLFGNMLDNAIEATREQDDKTVELRFFIKNNYQNVICKNPINSSVIDSNPHLSTTKREKQYHGYGVRSMRDAVDRAKGFIDFYEEEGHFCVHVALPI